MGKEAEIERLLPIIAKLIERIVRLFNSTLDDVLERAMEDEETRDALECVIASFQHIEETIWDLTEFKQSTHKS